MIRVTMSSLLYNITIVERYFSSCTMVLTLIVAHWGYKYLFSCEHDMPIYEYLIWQKLRIRISHQISIIICWVCYQASVDKRSQREIADVAGVADVTIRLKKEFFCLFLFLCFVLLKSSTHLVVSLPGSHHKAKLVFFCLIVTITIADMLLLQAKLQADVASGQWALPSRLQVRHSCGAPASELISNHLHQNWTTYWRWPDIKIEHKKAPINWVPIENWSHVSPRNEQPHLPHYCNTLLFFKSTIQY